MTNNGGTQDEPTSYALQPPAPRPAPARVPAPLPGPAPDAGRRIGGRYRLLERLGAGGMGTVWRARDEVVDRDVAVKEARVPEHFSEPERRTAYLRMEREARAAARIDHPSVVTIHDVVTEDGRPWIVMELLRGRSLAEVLDEGTLAPHEAARIGLAVLGALTAAHEAGVLHRDVKPGNVMVGRHDRVVLTDFGIAQVEGEERLTDTGSFIGSPEYLAPERVLGRRPGPESDLWSLGVMLYQSVEGVSPFRRQTTASTLQAVLLAEIPPPQNAGDLAGPITGLLRKEPETRLTARSAQPLLHTVAQPAGDRPDRPPTMAAGADVPEPAAATWARRLRGPYGIAAAAALAVAVIAALVLVFTRDGLPDGWKEYDEYRMHLTVAAPADWSITVEDKLDEEKGDYRATRYTTPKGDQWLVVDRQEKTTETARAIADRWKQQREAATPPTGGSRAVVTVESTTHQGRDAALYTETYNENTTGAPRRLHKFLIVVTSRQERLTLAASVPDSKAAGKTADELLDKARAGFEIRRL